MEMDEVVETRDGRAKGSRPDPSDLPNTRRDPIFPLTPTFHYVKVEKTMRATSFLLSAQNSDGGWGYKCGGMSYVEPTAAALLALEHETSAAEPYNRGLEFLRGVQHDDGGWGITPIDEDSGWMTAWAVWALERKDGPAISRGSDWLLQTKGIRVTDPATVAGVRQVLKIDASLTGWPWQVGDASWVFPTSLALLALGATGHSAHPRVQEGIRYLLDRAIPSGGWNIGNPFIGTDEVPATFVTTSLALISLGGFGVSGEVVEKGKNWLAQKLPGANTAAEIAWGAWAARITQLDPGPALEKLRSLCRPDGSLDGNPFSTAVGILAGRGKDSSS